MKMKENLNEQYQGIIKHIIDNMIPVDWVEMEFKGTITFTTQGYAINPVFRFQEKESGEYVDSHEIPKRYDISQIDYKNLRMNLCEKIYELHKLFKDNHFKLWNEVKLTVDCEGKVNSSYTYDDDNELYYKVRNIVNNNEIENEEKVTESFKVVDVHLREKDYFHLINF